MIILHKTYTILSNLNSYNLLNISIPNGPSLTDGSSIIKLYKLDWWTFGMSMCAISRGPNKYYWFYLTRFHH